MCIRDRLYSYYGKNFVKTIVNAGKKFGKLEVVNDQCGNPTNAVDLAHEILQLCVKMCIRDRFLMERSTWLSAAKLMT